ncbi:MAG: hypothetical protein ACRDYA_23445 [Egibacteraceae bacterium]
MVGRVRINGAVLKELRHLRAMSQPVLARIARGELPFHEATQDLICRYPTVAESFDTARALLNPPISCPRDRGDDRRRAPSQSGRQPAARN